MKLLKRHFALILITINISCGEADQVDKEAFGIKNSNSVEVNDLSPEQYNTLSLKLLNQEKSNLQVVLPNIILNQVSIYKALLSEWEKKKVYSSSPKEYEIYLQEENSKALDSLVVKDIEVNMAYLQLIDRLEDLNIMYAKKYNIPIDTLKSFYELDKIILSDEVFVKIQELVKEDQLKDEKLRRDSNFDLATNAAIFTLGFLPHGGSIAKLSIDGISKGLKYAKHGYKLTNDVPKIGILSYNVANAINKSKLGNSLTNNIIRTVSTTDKRLIRSDRLEQGIKRGGANLVVPKAFNAANELTTTKINIEKTREYFKVIENKIEGRIGDFSDGILAVHLQNAREKIKYNQNIVSVFSITGGRVNETVK